MGASACKVATKFANLVENKIMENIDDVRAVHVHYH